jgi:hypothetical protein
MPHDPDSGKPFAARVSLVTNHVDASLPGVGTRRRASPPPGSRGDRPATGGPPISPLSESVAGRQALGSSCGEVTLLKKGRLGMQCQQLGRSGLRVSRLTLGTMTFGGRGQLRAVGHADLEGARRQVDMALNAGVNR